jgi:small GTP-binding protein
MYMYVYMCVKIVMLGDSNVGKTCLLTRFLDNSFGNTQSTIGASYFKKTFSHNNKSWKLGLWDTAGQERYNSLSSFYCRGAGCAIVCFDLTDRKSFDNVSRWINKFQTSSPCEDYFIILVGTKVDLVKDGNEDKRAVSIKEASSLSSEVQAIAYVETSGKTGENIERIFQEIVAKYATIAEKHKDKKQANVSSAVRLNGTADKNSNNRCC